MVPCWTGSFVHAATAYNRKVVTNGSLHKVRDPKKYDLVIVDEVHKFRNDTSDAFAELQRICKSGTQRRLPDGTNAAKRIILVTATPLNNSPQPPAEGRQAPIEKILVDLIVEAPLLALMDSSEAQAVVQDVLAVHLANIAALQRYADSRRVTISAIEAINQRHSDASGGVS